MASSQQHEIKTLLFVNYWSLFVLETVIIEEDEALKSIREPVWNYNDLKNSVSLNRNSPIQTIFGDP